MNITLYENYSDNRTVTKNITPLKTIPCKLKNDCTLTNPIIIISKESLNNWVSANYAYIDIFKRYYYINDVKLMTAERIEINLKIDVLMSFADQIKSISGVIDRQEFLTNSYITDEKLPIRSKRTISYKKIGSLGNSSTIVLTATGGGEN